jgi:hypothetical protein
LRGTGRLESLHESYSSGEAVKPPSDRSTGLVFAAVAALAALGWRHTPLAWQVALGLAALLVIVSIAAPWVLRPLNLVWFRIGLLLHKVVNPVVMLALFVVVFLPGGLLMRVWADPLKRRRAEPGKSYWIDRAPGAQGSMSNQF